MSITFSLSILLSVDPCIASIFWLRIIVDIANMNMGMQISLQDPAFNLLASVLKSGIARSFPNSTSLGCGTGRIMVFEFELR